MTVRTSPVATNASETVFIMTESRPEPTGDQLHRKRSAQRAIITKLISEAKAAILRMNTTPEEIFALKNRLDYQSTELRKTDRDIEPHLTGPDLDKEFMDTVQFRDYIVTWRSILTQATQFPRSQLRAISLHYDHVPSQFEATTADQRNVSWREDASQANASFDTSYSCVISASNKIEDHSDDTEDCSDDIGVHETTPTAAAQTESEDRGMPTVNGIYPDVLSDLTGPTYNETTVIEHQHNVNSSPNRDISCSDMRITIKSSQSGREDPKPKVNSCLPSDGKNYIRDRTEEKNWHNQPSSRSDNRSTSEAIIVTDVSSRQYLALLT